MKKVLSILLFASLAAGCAAEGNSNNDGVRGGWSENNGPNNANNGGENNANNGGENNANNANNGGNNANNGSNNANNMACVEGARSCNGTTIQSCTGGTLTDEASCPIACDAGACVDEVTCTANSYRCNSSAVEVCSPTGSAFHHVMHCQDSCDQGLCVGTCVDDTLRCNGSDLQMCTGGSFATTETCSNGCFRGSCVLDSLDIAIDTELSGDIYVNGPVIVRSGVTVDVPSGYLNIHAESFTMEQGVVSVNVLDNNDHLSLRGYRDTGLALPGYDRENDPNNPIGGGVFRVDAKTIDINGEIYARGGNDTDYRDYAGDGGTILLMGETITLGDAAYLNADGGTQYYSGSDGYIKLLSVTPITDEDIQSKYTGQVVRGLLPPQQIYSSTFPQAENGRHARTVYNDGIDAITFTWDRPFDGTQGYYFNMGSSVPTPQSSTYANREITQVDIEA